MTSEVAPCMPLQLFRRVAGARRVRPQDVCRRLSDDLDSLAATRAPPTGSQGSVGGTSSGSACHSEQHREHLRRTLSEDVQRQLHSLLEVLEEAAERSERGGCSSDHPQESAAEFLSHFLGADLPARLVRCLGELDFEVRKDVICVFSTIARMGSHLGADQQMYDYAMRHRQFYESLVEGYDQPEVATHCGIVLRSCARHRRLAEAFLEQPEVAIRLLTFTRHESFDISSDAFSSLHDLLLTHKALSANFLEANFVEFFRMYNSLLQMDDYVTQRQALKLLSEMLLDRTFMKVMLAYIGDEQFLQIHMNLLRADSKAIQIQAFHVFKIFVANPQKPPRVQQILYKNKEKLLKLLDTLRPSRSEDHQFVEDKATVVAKLQALEPPAKPAAAAGAGAAPGSGDSSQVAGEAERPGGSEAGDGNPNKGPLAS